MLFVHHFQALNLIIKNLHHFRQNFSGNIICLHRSEHQTIRIRAFSVTVKVNATSRFFLQDEEYDGGIFRKLAQILNLFKPVF